MDGHPTLPAVEDVYQVARCLDLSPLQQPICQTYSDSGVSGLAPKQAVKKGRLVWVTYPIVPSSASHPDRTP